jgi:D-alanyl-D-alanine carboxypeptidase/D-alanyl-D-alanine-endopeptidase (penicillin-binding protein 4)
MGDPSISGRYSDQDVLGFFSQWRDTLLILGIKEISGDIIGNESYFSNPRLGYGWWWDDEPFWYAAQISALSFNNNCIDLKIWAGQKEGDSLIVVTDPVTDYIQIINNAYTVHADSPSTLKVTRQRARNVINITDGLPAAKSKEISITVENPALWFLNVLSSVFSAGDINVQGQLKVDNEVFNTEGKQKLFAHYSPELKKLIKILNKESNNFYAEQLYKTLGAVYKNEGSAEKGGEVLTDWTQKIGINESQYINKDGSGLSRANLVSPVAIVTLLRHMYYSNNFPHYLNSMAIAGIDGTLKERMVDNTARVILKAKTGYVSHARNLSGYLNDPQGNLYILVVMVNHYSVPTSYINSLQDKIAGLLADYIQN